MKLRQRMETEMAQLTHFTLGVIREDADLEVLGAFNNSGGLISEYDFISLVEAVRQKLAALTGDEVVALSREDIVDIITLGD